MWTRLHRPSSWRIAPTPSLSIRPALHRRVFSSSSAYSEHHGSILPVTGDAAQAAPSSVEDRVLDAQGRARMSVSLFSSAIRNAPTSAALMKMWSVLSHHKPVFVQGGSLQLADPQTPPPHDQALLRMVSMQELLQLHKQGQQHAVVMRTLPPTETVYKDLPVSSDRVLLVGENFVTRKIVTALHRLEDYPALVQFVDTITASHERELEAASLADAATDCASESVLAQLAELNDQNDRLYVEALGELKLYAQLMEHVAPHASDLSRYFASRDAFKSLLTACVKTHNGALARAAIDQIMDGSPLLTFNTRTYTAALHANLRAKRKTREGLDNAMHIYRRMFHEAGYVLAPQEWSLLFNSCIYLSQPHLAMEIFKDYRAHGIAPFQRRFEQALRTACRFQQFDTVIAMARHWMETETTTPCILTSLPPERLHADEEECLNKILWEMFKDTPTLNQVEQIVRMMETRHVAAGALVIRRLVTRFFTSTTPDEEAQPPELVVARFLDLWESCPQVIQRTGFVLHLVLEACSEHGWRDQCRRVLQYATHANLELPIKSATKIMEQYAAQGEFDEAIALGELVLEPRLKAHGKASRHQPQQRLPDAFFECLLSCYGFRERFEDVARVGDAFKLGERRGESNATLAAIVRDAKNMIEY